MNPKLKFVLNIEILNHRKWSGCYHVTGTCQSAFARVCVQSVSKFMILSLMMPHKSKKDKVRLSVEKMIDYLYDF